MPFSYMHVFPYSVRERTPASRMQQVQDSKKTIRANRLRSIAKAKKEEFIQSLLGQNIEVLIENKRAKSGRLKGVSSNYLQVELDGDNNLQNQIVTVKIVKNDSGMVLGQLSN